jgi:hypothetical protein
MIDQAVLLRLFAEYMYTFFLCKLLVLNDGEMNKGCISSFAIKDLVAKLRIRIGICFHNSAGDSASDERPYENK